MTEQRLLLLALALFCLVIFSQNSCKADVDSGCPSWGCLPWGSFSLSAGVPSQNSTIPWMVELETVSSTSDQARVPRGCVSDQQTVVCTTQSGYVSVDPTNGKKLWNYTTMSAPYLPIMDIYGDVIGMDSKAMYYVGADGKPKQPIKVGILKPLYSLMVANNSIMFLTGSTNNTAQIVTYDTDGIVDGAIPLRGWTENMNGTFIPCSQPIIAGHRAYVMTYFLPDARDSKEARGTSGMLRLYAIDVLHQLMPRIVVAWYYDFGPWIRLPINRPSHFSNSDSKHSEHLPRRDALDPIVTFFNGTVYVNVPRNRDERNRNSNSDRIQPYQGSLWVIRDDGKEGKLIFGASCLYGRMAVYDTYDNPLSKSEPILQKARDQERERFLWIANRSPAMIQGYNTRNGTIRKVSGFDSIFQRVGGVITSSLSITRSTTSPNNDQLVFGTTDSSGRACISVVEVDGDDAKLVLSRIVSKEKTSIKTDSQAMVEGQIVNFAFYPPIEKRNTRRGSERIKTSKNSKDTWKLGLAAVVTETNSTSITRTVVGIF